MTVRPRYLGQLSLAVLLGFYGWMVALIVEGVSGSASHGGVTLQHWLQGVLVVYLGGLVWAVGFTGSTLVASTRAGFSARYILGYGPRLARVRAGGSRLEWRLWPVRANRIPDPSPDAPTLQQQARILRSGLWSGIVIAAVLAALAAVLPGRAWLLALAVFPLVLGLNGLLQRRVSSPAGHLRVIKTYPKACELLNEANAALGRQEFDRVVTLSTQALGTPANSMLTLQFHALAATATARLGRFSDSADHWAAVGGVAVDRRIKTAAAAHRADARLAEALRQRIPVTEQDLEQFRTVLAALPAPQTPAGESAHLHCIALLRLAESDPADAASLCERSLGIDADSGGLADRSMVVATLVIAYARNGRESEARKLLAELPPAHPLYEAATSELSTAI